MATKPTLDAATSGVFVKGVVVSARARYMKSKNGKEDSVVVSHEIATQPGIVTWDRYHSVGEVKLQGETVLEFPRVADFQQVVLHVEKYRIFNEKLIVSGKIIAN